MYGLVVRALEQFPRDKGSNPTILKFCMFSKTTFFFNKYEIILNFLLQRIKLLFLQFLFTKNISNIPVAVLGVYHHHWNQMVRHEM